MPELARHQRDAVERALALIARNGGAILADDVGLGKSYVAASVAGEWQRRGSDVEIIVPASLTGQWRETLRELRVEGRIITHDTLENLARLGKGPFRHQRWENKWTQDDKGHWRFKEHRLVMVTADVKDVVVIRINNRSVQPLRSVRATSGRSAVSVFFPLPSGPCWRRRKTRSARCSRTPPKSRCTT